MDFHNLKLETFCHQTEDAKKVKKALVSLIPPGIDFAKRKDLGICEERVEGSFGNRILILSVNFKRQPDIRAVLSNIAAGLSPSDAKETLEYLDDHIEGTLFILRLDKQAAFNGEIKLGVQDTIQLSGKVAAYPAKHEKAVKLMKGLWKTLLNG